jgi:hypothetical protein
VGHPLKGRGESGSYGKQKDIPGTPVKVICSKLTPSPGKKKKTQNKTNDKRNTAIAIVLRLFLNIVLEITLAKCKRILIVPLIHGAGYPNNFTNAITGESFWFITNM